MPKEQTAQSFWDHIGEFGKRMKIVLVTFIVSALVMLVLPGNGDFLATTDNYAPLMSVFLSYISKMFLPANVKLFAVSVSDPITLYVMAAVLFSLIFTIPVFAYEAYKFVAPALYAYEQKAIIPFVSVVSVLFIIGIVFGFFFLFPSFIQGLFPFFSAVGAEPWLPIMDFYSMLFFTLIISGILFTVPAFFVLLVKFGILRTRMFTHKRKWIYLGLVVAAMLISPGATPQGNLYLFFALAIIFELSMLIGKRVEKTAGPANVPKILQVFSPNIKCQYCNAETDINHAYCPNCKKAQI
jgi:sec-independent protein translocase protein TatC